MVEPGQGTGKSPHHTQAGFLGSPNTQGSAEPQTLLRTQRGPWKVKRQEKQLGGGPQAVAARRERVGVGTWEPCWREDTGGRIGTETQHV